MIHYMHHIDMASITITCFQKHTLVLSVDYDIYGNTPQWKFSYAALYFLAK